MTNAWDDEALARDADRTADEACRAQRKARRDALPTPLRISVLAAEALAKGVAGFLSFVVGVALVGGFLLYLLILSLGGWATYGHRG
jgi:hypothetical protein